jgi:esterase
VAYRFGADCCGDAGTVELSGAKKCFNGPVQFIGGENSAYLKFEYHLLIRKFFPESRITMLKNCGHWPHVEQPNAFQKTVNKFLQYNNLI